MGYFINQKYKWDEVMEPYENQIRADLELKDEFLEIGSGVLEDVKRYHLKRHKKKKMKNLTFVGVHMRRTDSASWYSDNFGVPLLKPSYYLSAMDIMVNSLKVKKKSVAFVVITDDQDWADVNVVKKAKGLNIYLVGTGNKDYIEAAGIDLAIIANCNHTILSYGTYSFWAGFMAGGKRITPGNFFTGRLFELDSKQKPFQLPDQTLGIRGISHSEPFH